MRNLHENNWGKFPNDEQGVYRAYRSGNRIYGKKVCEQLTDITSGMSEEEKQDYEKKNSGKIATRCELICRGVKLSENSQSRIISKCNACKNSKTTIERAVKTL